jgi:membrane-associated protein
MSPARFYTANIPAVLLWGPAHVLPGVVAISALHRLGGIPHHVGLKHYWMIAVIVGASIVALVTWAIRRRENGGIQPAAGKARGRS